MRVLHSFRNVSYGMIQSLVKLVLGFICRSIFIATLGITYQGLSGLFTGLISMLSIAELGIGTALVYSMYKPIADNDIDTIKSIMRFYRNSYRIIAAVVLVLGLTMTVFLHEFSSYKGINENIYFIFSLFLLNSIVGYLFAYKRSIIYANQENYLIAICDIVTLIVMNIIQIWILLTWGNFILYLVIAVVCTFTENLVINSISNRKYPFLKDKNVEKISREILYKLKKQLYGLFMGQIGAFIVFGTDSIIISKFLGLSVMGIYSNYTLLSTAVVGILDQIATGATASVGNLLTENEVEKNLKIFNRIDFMIFWLYAFSAISLFVISRPFITMWLGKNFLLSSIIVFFFVLNFYIQGMRGALFIFYRASGMFYETRRVPVVESIINLTTCVSLGYLFGISGILIGNILSTVYLLFMIARITFKPILKQKSLVYYKQQVFFLLIFLIVFGVSVGLSTIFIQSSSTLINLIISIIFCLIVPNVLLLIIFHKNTSFIYFRDLLFSRIGFQRK